LRRDTRPNRNERPLIDVGLNSRTARGCERRVSRAHIGEGAGRRARRGEEEDAQPKRTGRMKREYCKRGARRQRKIDKVRKRS